MKCQRPGCSNDSIWTQMTIFDEKEQLSRLGEEHYCGPCMAALGGTYKDVPATGSDMKNEYVPLSG